MGPEPYKQPTLHLDMKTKIFSGFAVLALWITFPATAQTTVQYVTVVAGYLNVQSNQLVSLIGYDWINKPRITAGYLLAGNYTYLGLDPYSTTNSGTNYLSSVSASIPQTVTGLSSIQVNVGWATFKIETPCTATVISNYVPADAIVIPASVTGNVQIILESSPDLVNWTAANPGTYGPSAATNRFFRVRAAVIP